MSKTEDRVLHIRVPEDIHRFLRMKAAELDMSVTEYVTQLLEKAKEKDAR